MVKRRVVFRRKRQNRLGMFLVTLVVLMLLVEHIVINVGHIIADIHRADIKIFV